MDVLDGINAPTTDPNVVGMLAWDMAEGRTAMFNLLDTTLKTADSTPLPGNSAGVQEYPNWDAGVNATVQTLQNYGGILTALRQQQGPQALAKAVGASPWGTSGSLISQVAAGWGNGKGAGVIQSIGYGGSAVPGAGGGDLGSGLVGLATGAAGAAWGAFGAPIAWGEALAKFLGQLLDRKTWIRFGEIIGGLVLGLGGLIVLAKALGADSAVAGVAGKVAPIAALAA